MGGSEGFQIWWREAFENGGMKVKAQSLLPKIVLPVEAGSGPEISPQGVSIRGVSIRGFLHRWHRDGVRLVIARANLMAMGVYCGV